MQHVVATVEPELTTYNEGGDSDLGTSFLRRNVLSRQNEHAYLGADGCEAAAIEVRVWPGPSRCSDTYAWWNRLMTTPAFREFAGKTTDTEKHTELYTEYALDALTALAIKAKSEKFNNLKVLLGFDLVDGPNGVQYGVPKIMFPTEMFDSFNMAEKAAWAGAVVFTMSLFSADNIFNGLVKTLDQIKQNGLNPDVEDILACSDVVGWDRAYRIRAFEKPLEGKPASRILDYAHLAPTAVIKSTALP